MRKADINADIMFFGTAPAPLPGGINAGIIRHKTK